MGLPTLKVQRSGIIKKTEKVKPVSKAGKQRRGEGIPRKKKKVNKAQRYKVKLKREKVKIKIKKEMRSFASSEMPFEPTK